MFINASSNGHIYPNAMFPNTLERMGPIKELHQTLQMSALSQMLLCSQMGPLENCSLSAGANALLLLRQMSSFLEPLMQTGGSVPYTPNFGDEPVRRKPRTAKPLASPPSTGNGGGAKVRLLKQSNGNSCGQTSVAMSVNALTGKNLTDLDIDNKYGFGLLNALNKESKGSGYRWSDAGNLSSKSWPTLEKKLNKEKTPVIIGLNGQFSPTGRGHIVTLLSIDGNKVTYADPADGKVKTTTKQAIEKAPPHPDGKFLFVANKG